MWLFYLLLRGLHILQSLIVLVSSVFKRVTYHTPLPLLAARRLVPKHLAVLFVWDEPIDHEEIERRVIENVALLVGWCSVVGIEKLSLYDSQGLLVACQDRIREIMASYHDKAGSKASSDVEIDFPPTPPYSDTSRPLSPSHGDGDVHFLTVREPLTRRGNYNRRNDQNRRKLPTIYILSSHSSKEAVASVARNLAQKHQSDDPKQFSLSVNELGFHLEHGVQGLPSPDFMIVHPLSPWTYHRAPLELHGYPPWQIRLTEIYLNRYHRRHRTWATRLLASNSRKVSLPLTELEFREALDNFAVAEMRFGK